MLRLVEQSGAHKAVLSTREAAVYAVCSTATIRRWIADGLPASRRDGIAGYHIRRTDLDAWLTSEARRDDDEHRARDDIGAGDGQ